MHFFFVFNIYSNHEQLSYISKFSSEIKISRSYLEKQTRQLNAKFFANVMPGA